MPKTKTKTTDEKKVTKTNKKTKKEDVTKIDVVEKEITLKEKYQKMVNFVKNISESVTKDLKRMQITLDMLAKFDPEKPETLELINWLDKTTTILEWNEIASEEDILWIVIWEYDWYYMIWEDQKEYPVPLNYASKTKLIPWDKLKLKILKNGKFVYKLILQAERKHLKAILSKTDWNRYIWITDEWKIYFLNQAAVSFFRWKIWDSLFIIINSKKESDSAAIEALIKQ